MKLVDLTILVFLSTFITTYWLLGDAHCLHHGFEHGAMALAMVVLASVAGLHLRSYMRHRHALFLPKKYPFAIKALLFIRFLDAATRHETRLTSALEVPQ